VKGEMGSGKWEMGKDPAHSGNGKWEAGFVKTTP